MARKEPQFVTAEPYGRCFILSILYSCINLPTAFCSGTEILKQAQETLLIDPELKGHETTHQKAFHPQHSPHGLP